jgi:hypothetical protein
MKHVTQETQLKQVINNHERSYSQLLFGSKEGLLIDFDFDTLNTAPDNLREPTLYILSFNDSALVLSRLLTVFQSLIDSDPENRTNLADRIQEVSIKCEYDLVQAPRISYTPALGILEYSSSFWIGPKGCLSDSHFHNILSDWLRSPLSHYQSDSIIAEHDNNIPDFNYALFNEFDQPTNLVVSNDGPIECHMESQSQSNSNSSLRELRNSGSEQDINIIEPHLVNAPHSAALAQQAECDFGELTVKNANFDGQEDHLFLEKKQDRRTCCAVL